MKKTLKRENNEFLVISLKHVSGLTGHENRHGAPKLWAIVHENGHKTRNQFIFVVIVNLPRTQKRSSNTKTTTFWSYLSNMYRVLRAIQVALIPPNCGQ